VLLLPVGRNVACAEKQRNITISLIVATQQFDNLYKSPSNVLAICDLVMISKINAQGNEARINNVAGGDPLTKSRTYQAQWLSE